MRFPIESVAQSNRTITNETNSIFPHIHKKKSAFKSLQK